MLDLGINAPDWNTLYTARMARNIMFGGEKGVKLKDLFMLSRRMCSSLFHSQGSSFIAQINKRLQMANLSCAAPIVFDVRGYP